MSKPVDPRAEYPHPLAFAVLVARNGVVQGLGLSMVTLVALGLLPWPVVLTWTGVTLIAVAAENRLLRWIARAGGQSIGARLIAPALRLTITSLYAAAVYAFLTRGDLGEHLFASALISASVVNVLMRHYRAPRVLLVSLSPYLAALCAVCFVGHDAAVAAPAGVNALRALAPFLAIALFAVQIWTARAQLSGAWSELTAAREAAEQRESAAQAANLTKSQFLTTMSHELRTPLHGVLGMAQALRNDALTPVQAGRVTVILQQGESLLGMLNDLLDLSRIETGSLALEIGEFDLEHLARGVAAAYEPQALRKGLAFAFDISESARGRYLGDAPRIRRILYGLTANAVKFTAAGQVSLSVDRVEGALAFRVEDSGIGIGETDRQRLFEGFFQADSTLARPYDGAGIGLAVCSQLTALMGGQIQVDSRLGEGSTFTLILPLPQVEPAPQPPRLEPEAPRPGRPLRILAAEDNLINQMVLRTFLEPSGIDPVMVETGRQALEAWEKDAWDVILMDIQMPDMNGVEATKAIRLREQQTGRPRTPIIAVTASAMAHQLEEFAAVGIDGVAAKPVNAASLLRMINQAVSDEVS